MTDFSKKKSSTHDSFSQSSELQLRDGQIYKVIAPVALGLLLEPLTFICDSIKTRLQVSSTIENAKCYKCTTEVIKQTGVKQLYTGFGSGVLSKFVYLFSKYKTYEATKYMFHAGVQKVSFWRTYSGLILAETVASLFQAPFEIIKTRLICSSSKSIREVIRLENQKLLSCINGLNFVRLISLRGCELIFYLSTNEMLVKNVHLKPNTPETFILSIIAASIAGSIICSPFDYMKSIKSMQDYSDKMSSLKYFIKNLKESKGRNLYKGFIPLLAGNFLNNFAFFGLDFLRFHRIAKF